MDKTPWIFSTMETFSVEYNVYLYANLAKLTFHLKMNQILSSFLPIYPWF